MYYNAERDRLDTYSGSTTDTFTDISLADFSSDGTFPVVQTADVKATLGNMRKLQEGLFKSHTRFKFFANKRFET